MPYSHSISCAQCHNQSSISSCIGCKRDLCPRCFEQHRNELSLEFDELVNQRNELVETMHNYILSDKTSKGPCFTKINRWQTEMHANIDRTAEIARANIRQSFNNNYSGMKQDIDQISKDLNAKQKSNGYTENELNETRQRLSQLNNFITNFNEQIEINTNMSEKIQWNLLLTVVPKKTSTPPHVASNPPLYNSNQTLPVASTPAHHRRMQPNQPTHTPMPHSQINQLNQSAAQSRPQLNNGYQPYHQNHPSYTSMPQNFQMPRNVGPASFVCVGCKTLNHVPPSGLRVCSVCKFPAPF